MFRNAKIGDKAWDIKAQEYKEIVWIIPDELYPIHIKGGYSYDFSGKRTSTDKYPSIIWQEFEIPKEAMVKPLPELEVDTKVTVWNDCPIVEKEKRHFSHFNKKGKIHCFADGKTSWTMGITHKWDNWELADLDTGTVVVQGESVPHVGYPNNTFTHHTNTDEVNDVESPNKLNEN